MNKYQLLQSLKPYQALVVLNGAASSVKGQGLEQIRMKLLMADRTGAARVMLIAPNSNSPLATAMREAYSNLFPGGGMRMADELPADSVDLRIGVAMLLALPRQDEEPALLAPSDYLVVASHLPSERAKWMYGLIASTATQVATSAWDGPEGQIHLFHVVADGNRDEAFTTLVRDRLGAPVLRAYEVGRSESGEPWLLFADEGRQPGRQTLASFAGLVRLAPEQFADGPRGEGSTLRDRKLLAALVPRVNGTAPRPGADRPIDLLYLRHMRFLQQVEVAAPVRPPSEVRFFALTESEQALKNLRKAIDDAGKAQGVRVGYHLRLQPTRYVAEPHRDRDRLVEQKELIEQKIEYLDSTELPRPKLLRFTDDQLPALADYVRSFAMRVLSDERAIRYGFQSTAYDGRGVHFLLVDPRQAPQKEMNPLPFWERTGDPIIRFWLDPFWAQFYWGEGETLIYVPEGRYLTPTMHATSKRELDTYMRTVMGQWCRPEYGVPDIPRKPIYVFEPHPTNEGDLVIAVLDHEQFRPLGERLDWLNKHLHVRHARARGHEILDRNSDVLTDDEIIAELEAQKATRQKALVDAFEVGAARVSQVTGDLTRQLTEDLRDVLKLSQQTLDALRQAKDRLSHLYAAKAKVEALTTRADDAAKQTRAVAAAAGKEIEALRNEVQSMTAAAEQAHEDARRRIEYLAQLYDQLQDELNRR